MYTKVRSSWSMLLYIMHAPLCRIYILWREVIDRPSHAANSISCYYCCVYWLGAQFSNDNNGYCRPARYWCGASGCFQPVVVTVSVFLSVRLYYVALDRCCLLRDSYVTYVREYFQPLTYAAGKRLTNHAVRPCRRTVPAKLWRQTCDDDVWRWPVTSKTVTATAKQRRTAGPRGGRSQTGVVSADNP